MEQQLRISEVRHEIPVVLPELQTAMTQTATTQIALAQIAMIQILDTIMRGALANERVFPVSGCIFENEKEIGLEKGQFRATLAPERIPLKGIDTDILGSKDYFKKAEAFLAGDCDRFVACGGNLDYFLVLRFDNGEIGVRHFHNTPKGPKNHEARVYKDFHSFLEVTRDFGKSIHFIAAPDLSTFLENLKSVYSNYINTV